jgi:hypothetical protein
MTPEHRAVCAKLVEQAPAIIAAHARLPNRCILASRIGHGVLTYFGVPHQALVCNVHIYNPAYMAWADARGHGAKTEAEAREVEAVGGRVLILDDTVPGPGYSGHVVLLVGAPAEAFLDLDLQQFNRPGKDIALPAAGSFGIVPDQPTWSYHSDGGCGLYYTPRWGDTSYRMAPDWKRPQRAAVGALIRRLRLDKDSDCATREMKEARP